jgi:hypothetical protein
MVMNDRRQYLYLDVFHSELEKGACFSENNQFPMLMPTFFRPEQAIPFDKALNAKEKQQWVHFYIDDYRFERIWNNPKRYLPILRRFDGVITPDFSLYEDMPRAMQIWNTYRNRALGFWLQKKGLNVIPSLNWSDEKSYSFCFEGIARGCNVAISSYGTLRNPRNKELYTNGLEAMLDILAPHAIIHYSAAPKKIWDKFADRFQDMVVIDNYNITRQKKVAA